MSSIAAFVFALLRPDLVFAYAAKHGVTYSSECSCEGDHGVARWRAKTDPSEPPPNAADIRAITPSEMFEWQGPGNIPHGGGRVGNELHWFALTGRIISVQAEDDGDIHMVLVDAVGDKPGKVIAEIPLATKLCPLRTMTLSWTNAVFPFVTGQQQTFRLVKKHVITVVGKAFYDTDHSGKNHHENRRPRDKEKSVWEIHPVTRIFVRDADLPAEPATIPKAGAQIPPAKGGTEPKLSTAEAVAKARQLYPDLLNASSALYKEDWARYARYKQSNPHYFDDPEWPLNLADESAEALGIKEEADDDQ